MALTKVQIISLALMELGHQPISSLESSDQLVVAAEAIFDMKLPSVLSSGNWRFAIQIAQLSLLNETPPYPWQTAYSLPAGYLKNIRMYPNIYDFDIYQNERLYTYYPGNSSTPLMMEYVFQPDVSRLPAHFVDYFILEVAAPLALSNAQNTSYYQVLETKRVQMQAIAHAIETQNRPAFSQVMFPMLDNRYVSTMVGNSFNM
jgi:hypothetical protein